MTWKNKWILMMLIVAGSLILRANGWSEAVKAVPKAANPGSALAVIAGKPISLDDFRAEMKRGQGTFDAERKKELLDNMVRSELLFAAAKTAGYENDPEVVAIVKHAMAGKYLRDNLEPKLALLKVSDQEAEAYYQAHQTEFGTPAMLHAALIKIAVSPKSSADTRGELLKRAESARAEAEALAAEVPAFGSVAVNYSEDQNSRYRGGDIGWIQAGAIDGRWDRKVSDAISSLKVPGGISPVIDTTDGYYIVKLMEAKAATTRPFSAVKDGVRHQVLQEKKRQVEHEFIEQLKNNIPVTVNSGLLQTVDPPAGGKQARPPALPVR